jgi:DNA end-binding protein Ku
VLDVLRYEGDIKDADEVFAAIGVGKTRADMVAMAEQLIESRTEKFDPSKFKSHYAEALRALVKSKLSKGETNNVEDEGASQPKVIDFMDALKRSLRGGDKAPAPPAPPKPAREAAPKPAPKRAPPARAKNAPKRKRA